MKKLTIILSSAVAFTLLAFAPLAISNWTGDTAHSHLGFTINHMGIADIHGNFGTYEVKMTAPNADFSDATVELSGDVSSIHTGNDARDTHLKTADFFDATKYPKFTFKSTSFKKGTDDKTYTVVGQFTLHGVTKELTLTAVNNGSMTNSYTKKETTGFTISGSFKRSDFGIAPTYTAPMLSDEAKISCDFEFTKD